MKVLDLIDPKRSDIRYKRFAFPDGQPHFELLDPSDVGNGERVEVLCRIKSAADLVDVALALNVLGACFGRTVETSLNVGYMLGARMDRRIDDRQPSTLAVLSTLLTSYTRLVDTIRVLDPHSQKTLEMLDLGTPLVEAIYPDRLVKLALRHFGSDATIVIPDEGAVSRTSGIVERLGLSNSIARCVKKRDSQTGALSGFALAEGDVTGRDCLIVDDICDGGGTFAGIATVLREAGARSVALCVTHGIFSKGYAIAGIDCTYCTDSFSSLSGLWGYLAERDALGFTTYRRPADGRAVLCVLNDFLGEHVRANSD